MSTQSYHPEGKPALTPLPPRPRSWRWLYLIAWIGACVWMAWHLDIYPQTLWAGLGDMQDFASRFMHPDFKDIHQYGRLMVVTLAIALWGTALAVVAAVILAPLASRTFSPHPIVYRIARETLNAMRSMPDLLLALIFVAGMGLGALPGVLALGVHTAGFLGKFFAEALERVDRGTYEGVRSTGASSYQVLMFAGWPSINREFIGYVLYIFDRNVRMASVLGLVGAGGVGLALHDTLRMLEYSRAAALILVILVTLLVVDFISTWIRSRIS